VRARTRTRAARQARAHIAWLCGNAGLLWKRRRGSRCGCCARIPTDRKVDDHCDETVAALFIVLGRVSGWVEVIVVLGELLTLCVMQHLLAMHYSQVSLEEHACHSKLLQPCLAAHALRLCNICRHRLQIA
jgi:hypothetical protein